MQPSRCFYVLMSNFTRVRCFFFFKYTATTEIYTLSYTTLFRSLIHTTVSWGTLAKSESESKIRHRARDRKSTRLNSSHANISYAVFCLKKKKYKTPAPDPTNEHESGRHVSLHVARTITPAIPAL